MDIPDKPTEEELRAIIEEELRDRLKPTIRKFLRRMELEVLYGTGHVEGALEALAERTNPDSYPPLQ